MSWRMAALAWSVMAKTLAELEAIRLLLRGGSVIDWYRLNLESEEETRAFFQLLEGDPDDPLDLGRMAELRGRAAEYLTSTLGYRLPNDILACPPFELFAYASERRGRPCPHVVHGEAAHAGVGGERHIAQHQQRSDS